jgi:hypothetical protein
VDFPLLKIAPPESAIHFKSGERRMLWQLDVNSLCSQVFLTIGGSDFAAVGKSRPNYYSSVC